MAERSQPGLLEVLAIAAVAIAAVLGAAVVTSLLPVDVQRVVFREPVAIAVIVVGTVFVLWRVAARRPPEA
ncbi:MAG: hypothetical protein C0498_04675 [Anaerolinea sp.]|nr:hypothetical protein [Anaerolinea sp.]